MTLKMNYASWRDESFGARWLWEETQRLQLCLMDAGAQASETEIVEAIHSVLTEFQLPVQVEIAKGHECELIERLLTDCGNESTIDCCKFLEKLNEKRPGDPFLQAGLVIAFDGSKRNLWDGPDKPEEPPDWGWTAEDGLILLRLNPGQPLRNLVRHEMGHLLGVDKHHSGCVMDWSCANEHFCSECKQVISKACRVSDCNERWPGH
jgi:hypothetical protein